MKHLSIHHKGFTVVETVVAVSLLAMTLIGIYALAARSIGIGLAFRNELIASGLAAEGIEIVRSLRDTNWILGQTADDSGCNVVQSWRRNLCGSPGSPQSYELDVETPADAAPGSLTAYSVPGRFLNFTTDGRYIYGSGTQTHFKRRITIVGLSDHEMIVTVEMRWTGKGGNRCLDNPEERCFIIEDRLLNWLFFGS